METELSVLTSDHPYFTRTSSRAHTHTHTVFHTGGAAAAAALSRRLSRRWETAAELFGKVGVICLLKKSGAPSNDPGVSFPQYARPRLSDTL